MPFNTENQVEHLVKYWKKSNSSLQDDEVRAFASQVLNDFKATAINREPDIFTVPFHCQVIAELYKDHVDNYLCDSNLSTSPPPLANITEFYSLLMEKKFEVGVQNINWTMDDFNKKHAELALMFFSPESQLIPNDIQLPENNVKIFRYFDVANFDSGTLQFSHITYAEYFFAWFLFSRINEEHIMELLVNCVLQIHDPNDISDYWDADNLYDFKKQITFKNFGVAYFLNHFLNNSEFQPENQISPVLNKLEETMKIDCISVCIYKNLWHILKLWGLSNFNSLYRIDENNSSAEYLFNTIEYCDLVAVDLALKAFKIENPTLMQEEVLFLNETLLHVAARRGNFSVFDCVFDHGKFLSFIKSDNHTIMHACVRDTHELNEYIIEGKLEIIEYLHKKSTSCIHQKNDKGLAPFLTKNIHPKLLTKLIDLNSNLREAPNGESILHAHTKTLTPSEYHNLILQIPVEKPNTETETTSVLEDLVLVPGFQTQTPLHRAVQDLELLPSTVEHMVSHGADPNCTDVSEDSVLGTAIRKNRKPELLKKLKELGSQLTYVNPSTRNTLFHIAAQAGNIEAIYFLLEQNDKKLIEELLFAANADDKSAAEVALFCQSPNQKIILDVLQEKDVRISPQTFELPNMNLNTFVVYKKYVNFSYDDEYTAFISIFTKFSTKEDRLDHKHFVDTKDLSRIEKIAENDKQQELILKYIGNAISRGDYTALENMLNLCDQNLAKIEMDYTLLHFAVKCGHYSIVPYLLQPIIFGNCLTEPRMKNLIHCCVAETSSEPLERIADKQKIVPLLCSHNLKMVFEPSKTCWEGTHQAILLPNVHASLLKCLIENGANVLEADQGNHKFCFLHRAACLPPAQFHEVLESLKSTDVKVLLTFENSAGHTPVHYALRQTVEECDKETFISTHIPVEIQDNTLSLLQNLGVRFDSSLIDTARKTGHSKEFVKKLEKLVKSETEKSAKQEIFDPTNRAYVSDLIKLGRDINQKDMNGNAPIHNVFQMATNLSFSDVQVDIVRQEVTKLINHGANVNIADGNGHTVIHLTVIKKPEKFMSLIRELVAAGADTSAVDNEHRNLLHLASIHFVVTSFHELVSYILSINPELANGHDIHKCTPLHYATLPISKLRQDKKVGQLPTLQLFINKGCDLNATDSDGNTVLMYAVSAMEYVDTSLTVDPPKQSYIVETLIQKRASLAHVNNNKVGLLHVAAYTGNTDIIDYLLSAGIQNNPRDAEENTPVHWAFIDKADAAKLMGVHMHSVTQPIATESPGFSFFFNPIRLLIPKLKSLLKYKPDVNCQNINKETPMDLAKKCSFLDDSDMICIKYLLRTEHV